jgi:hypothetical protein
MEIHVLFFIAAIVAGAINALLPAYPAAVWHTRGELSEVPGRWL